MIGTAVSWVRASWLALLIGALLGWLVVARLV